MFSTNKKTFNNKFNNSNNNNKSRKFNRYHNKTVIINNFEEQQVQQQVPPPPPYEVDPALILLSQVQDEEEVPTTTTTTSEYDPVFLKQQQEQIELLNEQWRTIRARDMQSNIPSGISSFSAANTTNNNNNSSNEESKEHNNNNNDTESSQSLFATQGIDALKDFNNNNNNVSVPSVVTSPSKKSKFYSHNPYSTQRRSTGRYVDDDENVAIIENNNNNFIVTTQEQQEQQQEENADDDCSLQVSQPASSSEFGNLLASWIAQGFTKQDIKILVVLYDLGVPAPSEELRSSWWWRNSNSIEFQYYTKTENLPRAMEPPKLVKISKSSHENIRLANQLEQQRQQHEQQEQEQEQQTTETYAYPDRIPPKLYVSNRPNPLYFQQLYQQVHGRRDDGYAYRNSVKDFAKQQKQTQQEIQKQQLLKEDDDVETVNLDEDEEDDEQNSDDCYTEHHHPSTEQQHCSLPSSLNTTPQKYHQQQEQQLQKPSAVSSTSQYEHDELVFDNEEQQQQQEQVPPPFFFPLPVPNSRRTPKKYFVAFRCHSEWFVSIESTTQPQQQQTVVEYRLNDYVVVNGDLGGIDVGRVEKITDLLLPETTARTVLPKILYAASAQQIETLTKSRNTFEANSVMKFLDSLPYDLLRSRKFAPDYTSTELYTLNSPSRENRFFSQQQQLQQQQDFETKQLRQEQDPLFDLYQNCPPSRDEVDEILRIYRQYNFTNAEFQFDKKGLCIYFSESIRYLKRLFHWKQEQELGSRARALDKLARRFEQQNGGDGCPSLINKGTFAEADRKKAENSLSACFLPEDYAITKAAFFTYDSTAPCSVGRDPRPVGTVVSANFASFIALLSRKFGCRVWLLNGSRHSFKLEQHPFHTNPVQHIVDYQMSCIQQRTYQEFLNRSSPVAMIMDQSTSFATTTTTTTTSFENNENNNNNNFNNFEIDQNELVEELLDETSDDDDDDDLQQEEEPLQQQAHVPIRVSYLSIVAAHKTTTIADETETTTTLTPPAPLSSSTTSATLPLPVPASSLLLSSSSRQQQSLNTMLADAQRLSLPPPRSSFLPPSSAPIESKNNNNRTTKAFDIEESPFMRRIRMQQQEQQNALQGNH